MRMFNKGEFEEIIKRKTTMKTNCLEWKDWGRTRLTMTPSELKLASRQASSGQISNRFIGAAPTWRAAYRDGLNLPSQRPRLAVGLLRRCADGDTCAQKAKNPSTVEEWAMRCGTLFFLALLLAVQLPNIKSCILIVFLFVLIFPLFILVQLAIRSANTID